MSETRDPDILVERLIRQLSKPEVRDYLRLARDYEHGIRVELYLLPDGSPGATRFAIDTRGDKRLQDRPSPSKR